MEELNQKRIDRAVLVGLNADCFPKEETATETTLDELEALLNTAGGECAGKILQNKHTPDPRSFIGEGKAEEVRQLVLSTGANMVIFDNDLTPSQTRTLEDILKTTVLDRSALILDIFAQRAKTREGKLQVELAQYQYYLPRLTVWNEEMGRLGGGIGRGVKADLRRGDGDGPVAGEGHGEHRGAHIVPAGGADGVRRGGLRHAADVRAADRDVRENGTLFRHEHHADGARRHEDGQHDEHDAHGDPAAAAARAVSA